MSEGKNQNFVRNGIKRPELDILTAGEATVYRGWGGEVASSHYSRLYFILRGGFYIESAHGERLELSVGKAYLIPSGYSFSYGCPDEARHLYFHIRLSDFDSLDGLSRISLPTAIPYPLDGERLSAALHTGDAASALLIESEIFSAISKIAAEHPGVLDAPTYSRVVANAIEYISNHLSVQLTVPEIAESVYTAQSTLQIRFRQETGMSVGEYIDYRVMLSAVQQLITTTRQILEISDSLGFCDQFYFSRRFKEKYGVSPRTFRKSAQTA
jgi:AraC-like DNA-binding protein